MKNRKAFLFTDERQRARLNGAEPRTADAALAMAKSQAYQDAADAPATLRAYEADFAEDQAWCDKNGFTAMPADPETVGAYLGAAGEGYAAATLRRRVAAIARACGIRGNKLNTAHPAIRETLRGIARRHGSRPRKSAALTTAEIKQLCEVCDLSLTGKRDRALLLIGFAGAFRRSELVALEHAHVSWTRQGLKLLVARSKTDKAGEGVEIAIVEGNNEQTCPVKALRTWLTAAKISHGPIFRKVNKAGRVEQRYLSTDAVRQILLKVMAKTGLQEQMVRAI